MFSKYLTAPLTAFRSAIISNSPSHRKCFVEQCSEHVQCSRGVLHREARISCLIHDLKHIKIQDLKNGEWMCVERCNLAFPSLLAATITWFQEL